MMGLALITQEIRLPSESAILKMDVESNQWLLVRWGDFLSFDFTVPSDEIQLIYPLCPSSSDISFFDISFVSYFQMIATWFDLEWQPSFMMVVKSPGVIITRARACQPRGQRVEAKQFIFISFYLSKTSHFS